MNYQEKYLKYKAKYLKLKSLEKSNGFNMTGGAGKKTEKPTLYLFKAEWCPHCIAFKPVWKDLESKMNSKIDFVMFDSETNSNEIKNFKIEGFPTIILKAGGKAIEYVGPRDFASVKEFVETYN